MLDVAVAEARKGLAEGGIPIGAALFSSDGTLLGSGHNRRVQNDDPSIHAETDAFRAAGRQRGYRSTVMVTTLSPCWYCSGLVRQFNIGALVIGESRTFTGGHDWLAEHGVAVTLLDDERCVAMMEEFIAAAARSVGGGHRRMSAIATARHVPVVRRRGRGRRGCRRGRRRTSAGRVHRRHAARSVDPDLAAKVRAASREFFALPDEVKQDYSVPVGGHGWIGPGAEANGYAEGNRDPARSEGAAAWRAETATGDPEVDRIWFAPNVWPAEVPALQTHSSTSTPPRCGRSPTTCWRCSPTLWDCRSIPCSPGEPADVDDEHQPRLSAGECGGRAGAGAVPRSARTPTSAL